VGSVKNSRTTVSNLEEHLLNEDYDGAMDLILKKNINLGDISGINYSFIKHVSKHRDVSNFNEYKELRRWLMQSDHEFVVKYVSEARKNPSRQKGPHFKRVIAEYADIINKQNGTDCVFSMEDALELEEFVYIPTDDSHISLLLAKFGLKTKLNKGRDILIRSGDKFFIGEAKDINEAGGAQDKQLVDMLGCADESDSNGKYTLSGFGVLYGACLFYNNKFSDAFKDNNILSLSALVYNFKNLLCNDSEQTNNMDMK